jgi:hypothetical protein
MIVLGKQINVKSIARAIIVVLASSWFIPISCTSLLFGLHEEPMMIGGGGLVADDFDSNHPDSNHFTIVAESKDFNEAFVTVPYSNIQGRNSLTFLMSKSKGSKVEKPIQLEKDGDRYVYSSVSYKVIEQGAQEQLIEVVRNVDMPHSYTIYKSRYKVENNNIAPISFKRYFDSFGASANIIGSFFIAIVIYLFSKLFLYLLFTKNENTKLEKIETNNINKYYWKGIIDGEKQEGEILAQNKEDATNQLRDKKVIITQLNLDKTRKYYWDTIVDGEKQEGEIYAESEHDVTVALWNKKIFSPKIRLAKNSQNNSIGLQSKPTNKNVSFIRKVFSIFGIVLLIPISIIVVLVITGVPMFQGFLEQAKVNASTEIHTRFSELSSMLLTKCSIESKEVILVDNTTSFTCPGTTDKFIDNLILYTKSNGWKNPYDPAQNCCSKSTNNPPLSGAPNTHVYATSDTEIIIKTNIGTIGGDNKWLIKKVTRTKFQNRKQ